MKNPATPLPLEGLGADGPHPELAAKLALFGQFIGDWSIEAQWYGSDGVVTRRAAGELHFGWILGGRAIQDVWIAYKEDSGEKLAAGTTIRFYDPVLNGWRCIWISPTQNVVRTFLAIKVGGEIVLEPADETIHERWIFSEITANSFRWRAQESTDERKTWQMTEEMRMRRMIDLVRSP
ncbi:MAG: hypothetical protein C5B50_05140 [Verrucomicrobia bacterium]|nr:MAG: hypothetical protein C5B50_05140 [Verrucomicrobiota bacterium]